MKNGKSIGQVKKEIKGLEYEADIDISEELKYTDDEIEKLLRKLPVAMFQAAQTLVLRFMDFKEAKRNLKKTFAVQMMKANNNAKLSAAPDRKAQAENSQPYERAEINLINAEAQYKIAEFRLEMLDNLYLAIKKMVIMRNSQNESEDRYSRSKYYKGEGSNAHKGNGHNPAK